MHEYKAHKFSCKEVLKITWSDQEAIQKKSCVVIWSDLNAVSPSENFTAIPHIMQVNSNLEWEIGELNSNSIWSGRLSKCVWANRNHIKDAKKQIFQNYCVAHPFIQNTLLSFISMSSQLLPSFFTLFLKCVRTL